MGLKHLWNLFRAGRVQSPAPLYAVGRAPVRRSRHAWDDTVGQTMPIPLPAAPALSPWSRRRRPVNQRG